MPFGIFRFARRARVESHAMRLPVLPGANSVQEFAGVEIRVVVAESIFGVAEEVLAVDESNGPGHWRGQAHKNNPAGALRHVRRGATAHKMGKTDRRVNPFAICMVNFPDMPATNATLS
jgi:hypothetical protein